jgi:hypothetical protein
VNNKGERAWKGEVMADENTTITFAENTDKNNKEVV